MPSRSDSGVGDKDGELVVDGGGTIGFENLKRLDSSTDSTGQGTLRAQVCRPSNAFLGPSPTASQRILFPYDNQIVWDQHGPRRRGDK